MGQFIRVHEWHDEEITRFRDLSFDQSSRFYVINSRGTLDPPGLFQIQIHNNRTTTFSNPTVSCRERRRPFLSGFF